MGVPRSRGACICAHGCIFVVGGVAVDADRDTAPPEKYDPRIDKWEVLAENQIHRERMQLAVLHDWIYAMGGVPVMGLFVDVIPVERYHIPSGRWEEVPVNGERFRLPGYFESPAFHAVVLDDSIYMIGTVEVEGTYDSMGDVNDTDARVKDEVVP